MGILLFSIHDFTVVFMNMYYRDILEVAKRAQNYHETTMKINSITMFIVIKIILQLTCTRREMHSTETHAQFVT